MVEDQFFSVVQLYVRQAGGILNTAMLRKKLSWSESQCQSAIETLLISGDVERAGGHFLRITDAGFERLNAYEQAAE